MVPIRAGEGTFAIAEQLGAHGLGSVLPARDGCPVLVLCFLAERAVQADPTGERRLPSTAFTENEHWNVKRREPTCFRKDGSKFCGLESSGVPQCRIIVEAAAIDRDGFLEDLVDR